jgi:predicted ATPase
LAKEVAYELIPFSQRRLLHAAMAKALEAQLKCHTSAAMLAEAATRY